MRVEFRTLARTMSALVIALMLVAGASMEAAAKGQRGRRGRDDNGRHLGWTRGRHRGWERSRSRHVRDNWWENRRERRRARRSQRRDWRRNRWETRRDRRDDRRDWRRFRRNRDRRVAIYRNY